MSTRGHVNMGFADSTLDLSQQNGATGSERNSESTSYDKAQPENTYNHTRQQQSDYQSPVDLPGVQMSYKNGGLVNGGYANSATDLKQLKGATGLQPYSNAFYAEAQPNNTYNTLQRQSTNNVRPRAQLPRLNPYEEVGPETLLARQKKKQNSRPSEKVLQRRRRDRWIRAVLMCLIVVVATAALILTIMLMMGKIGPKCSCGSTGSSQTAQQVSSDEPRNDAPNTFQTNLSPLHDIVEELEANLTALRAEAEALMQESAQNSDVLLSAKTEYNSTKDAVTPFSDLFQADLTQIHNKFEDQFDGGIGPITAELRFFNESKTNKLAELKQKSEQDNDDIDMTARSVNDTITDRVAIKISQPGPIGERGENGSQGPIGERGQNGTKGSVGIKGPKGEKGLKGDPGDNGISGSAGAKGDTGVKGPKGPQGAKGDEGAPGLDGPTGPRGIGNFSWCQWKKAEVSLDGIANRNLKATATDTQNVKIVAAYCSTDSAQEYNLQVTQSGNGNEYECVCKGGLGSGSELCILTYWECPIHAP